MQHYYDTTLLGILKFVYQQYVYKYPDNNVYIYIYIDHFTCRAIETHREALVRIIQVLMLKNPLTSGAIH